MALTQPIATRNAGLDARLDRADGGLLRVYTSPRPAPDSAATGTLLAEFDLASPAFAAAASGSKSLADNPATVGLAAGTAAWFRILTSAEATVIDGSCGTSGADAILNTTTVSVGLDLTVQSCVFTEPSGA